MKRRRHHKKQRDSILKPRRALLKGRRGAVYVEWSMQFGYSPEEMMRRIQRASGRPPWDEISVVT